MNNVPETQPIREHIRTELEKTRAAFLDLLQTISDDDLRRKSANAAWTVKELLFHIVLGLEYVPKEVNAARKGKNLMAMPQSLYDRLIIGFTRLGALFQNRQSLLKKYERAYDAVLTCLDSIDETEWQKTTTYFYVEATIEELFHRQVIHFEEHATQIRQGLGRE